MVITEVPMVSPERVRRKMLIRNAEGYLDLVMAFDDRWPLEAPLREQMADLAIESLARISNPQGFKPYILFLKGQAHRIASRFVQAINCLEQSLRLDEDNIHTLLALGWCYKRVGRIDAAIEVMTTAVKAEPESAIGHYNLACYYALDNNVDASAMHLSIALDLDYGFRDHVASETDFDLVRNDPVFRNVVSIVV